MVDYYLKLAEAAGCGPESPQLELGLTDAQRRLGDKVWQRLGLRADRPVVVLNSSGAYGAAKLWPAEHFAALAQNIVRQLDHDVLVLCGPSERDAGPADRGHGRPSAGGFRWPSNRWVWA